MKKNRNKSHQITSIIILFTLVLFINSCQSDGRCRQNTDVSVGLSFSYIDINQADSVPKEQTLNDTIKVYGVQKDSLLNDTFAISSIRVPLKPFEEKTSFVLKRDKQKEDTITFLHTNTEKFLSLECGVIFFYELQDIQHTKNQIDSVKILKRAIKDNKTKNQVKIYFKR